MRSLRSIVCVFTLSIVLVLLLGLAPSPVSAGVDAQGTAPRGLFVTDLRVSPIPPTYNTALSLTPTFQNTTETVQNFRWRVFIFRTDTPWRSFTETTYRDTSFAVGSGEYPTIGTFTQGPTGNTCDFLFARVGWIDANNQIVYFAKPDGSVFEKSIIVCDPKVLPTSTPAPTSAPSSTPALGSAGPGLYVTNIRFAPDQLTYNRPVSFFPTFSNTTQTVQNFRWRVYIFRTDTPWRSNTETTFSDTAFRVGAGEYSTIGTFTYGPTGSTCDFFFARIGWLDANNQVTYFANTDGRVFEKNFFVCDPKVLPTVTPAPTSAPLATPAPGSAGPGLYVTDMRFAPDQLTYNQPVSFFPTFSNTSQSLQSFRWRVYIFRSDTPWRSNTETTFKDTAFPTGTGEYSTIGTFRYGVTGSSCDFFFARVGWIDPNNQTIYFSNTDGRVFEKPFTICDFRVLPTVTPAPPAASAPTPRPDAAGAGLFVTDIRVNPSQPSHNQFANFTATFNNKTDSLKAFRWRIYIFRVDTPWRSNTETTFIGSSFPVGVSEYASLGSFHYGATGYTCDFFFARAGWVDENNKIFFFTNTDGQVFEKNFSVCE